MVILAWWTQSRRLTWIFRSMTNRRWKGLRSLGGSCAGHTAPGKSGLPAAAFKFLDGAASQLLYDVVVDVWRKEEQPEEFDTGVLAILPKKGDLSDPGNYRGIMMLEVAKKSLPSSWRRDAIRSASALITRTFNIRIAIKKRREHGLETWVFFLDLIKAFDRVPREMLRGVLNKFGAPPKLIGMVKALHAKVRVEFEVDGVSNTIDLIVGVQQGDVLGPVICDLHGGGDDVLEAGT